MRLTDDELRDVLARADEIQRSSRHGPAWNAEVAAVIGAAEEVGISREAVVRALEERLELPAPPPAVGSLAWAPSADGRLYVAEVLSAAEDGARVRFLRGGEHRVALDRLRQCGFLPGERVVCEWPWWGKWTCTVVAYDPAARRVKLSDGSGSTKSFPIADVWMTAPRLRTESTRARLYAALAGAVAAGAAIGSIITALVLG